MTRHDKGPPDRERPAATPDSEPIQKSAKAPPQHDQNDSTAWRLTSAQSVAWWEVHQYVDWVLECLGVPGYPAAGTPAWCGLDDCDPLKLAAVLDYGQHHALRVETAQVSSCAASRAISAAVNWRAISKRIQDENEWYAAHPWMRRVV